MEDFFKRQKINWKVAIGYGALAIALMFFLGALSGIFVNPEADSSLVELASALSLFFTGALVGRGFKRSYGMVQFVAEKQLAAVCLFPWLVETVFDVFEHSGILPLWGLVLAIVMSYGKLFIVLYVGALFGGLLAKESIPLTNDSSSDAQNTRAP